ncbi:kinesin-like protein KIF23 isoform X2 [Lineus longissimus]|uniref:kinesin-like protein KIF23 isoform X2 n=1 Tax=Lineus longissimus TaxID=88925 RepID=UPI00315DF795
MRNQKRRAPQKNKEDTDPVEVFCRIRPIDDNYDKCVSVVGPVTVQLTPPEHSQAYKNGNYTESQYSYRFVFEETTSQKAIYDHVAMPLVEDLLHGKNGLLFTYGITSSGKTHTMTGTPQEQGILPRCCDVIFNSIQELQAKKYVFIPDRQNAFDVQCEADAMVDRQRKDILPKLMTPKTPGTPRRHARNDRNDDAPRIKEQSAIGGLDEDTNYAVFVSYIEIYNNFVYDLLEDLPYDPITGYKPPQSKVLREDRDHNMYVHNGVEIEVKNTEEAFDVFTKGQKRRKVAHTALNASSSRSHSVFNIRLVQAPLDPIGEEVVQDKEKICVSQLSLVDLAGSERTNRTKNHGERLREAGNINQTLMVLRTCIECLRENQKNSGNKMVPFRDSRLTHLFKNYFDGEGKVKMIVCVNPKADEYDETVQVMRFAELTQEVQVARPSTVRFDLGYTPGRRKMNQQYKDQLNHMHEQEVPSVATSVRLYDIGPPFPMFELNDPSDTVTLTTLTHYLQERDVRRQNFMTDLLRKQDLFRTRLLDIDNENSELRCRFSNLETVVRTKETESTKLERKIRSLENQNRDLQRTVSMYDHDIKELKHEIEDKEQAVKKERTDKNRIRHDFENKLMLNNHQWEKALDQERQKMELECGAQIWDKDRKLKMVRHIINGDQASSSSSETKIKVPPPVAPKPRTTRMKTANSDTSISTAGTSSSSTAYYSAKSTVSTLKKTKTPPTTPSSGSTSTIPISNRRAHRRSRSAGADRWLDHKPAETLELSTVLQPKMKKKKSVTKLNVKDTMEADKYCLTHQEQDSNDEIVTKLIKGDVLPTAGGGTQVVFKDVETLKQISPGDKRKRGYYDKPEVASGDWTDTDERCNVAIEGHGYMKRARPSRV